MPLVILLLLIGLPLLEISVFVEVGSEIGAFWTVFATIATAVIGVALVRIQGMIVLARAREHLMRGEPLVEEAIHGMFLFLAGILLLIPGFITDAIGAILLLPPIRTLLGRFGMATVILGNPQPEARRDAYGNIVIEGQYRVTPDEEQDREKDPTHKD